MRKLQLLFAVIIMTAFTLVACDKDKPNNPDPIVEKHKLLYDKWWYNIGNQGRGANYFNSDGTCQMTIPPSTGVWKWAANDSLKVTMDGYPTVNLYFTKIEIDFMEYWPSNEPEGSLYQFSTTEP